MFSFDPTLLHEGKFCDSCAASSLLLLMLNLGEQFVCMFRGGKPVN